ncbi:MAG TPA: mechanosensitive ion channel family protein [Terracidiphilus sp.]|jgi:small-conductance mechanosensitive channel
MVAAIAVSLLARFIVLWLLRRVAHRSGALLGQSLVRHSERPTRWIFPQLGVLSVLPGLPLTPMVMSALEHIAGLGLIATTAWLVILLVDITSDIMAGRYRIDVEDNLVARRIQTQFQIMRRIVFVLVSVVTLAVMLMTFPSIKHIGMSILASAGLASLVVGVAMKDTLSNLIAGVQIAFAQPFRLEDAVIVEGEMGWIEEIGTMYVVVRIWDLRRLVVPLSYFLDHPFQNWTRNSADLLAYAYLYVDYTVPLDALRAELRRICESTPLWKGNLCVLQVSDAKQNVLELRALTDVRNASAAWDMRCLIREKMIDFLQKNYPGSLPRQRGEMEVSGLERMGRRDEPGSVSDHRGVDGTVAAGDGMRREDLRD